MCICVCACVCVCRAVRGKGLVLQLSLPLALTVPLRGALSSRTPLCATLWCGVGILEVWDFVGHFGEAMKVDAGVKLEDLALSFVNPSANKSAQKVQVQHRLA